MSASSNQALKEQLIEVMTRRQVEMALWLSFSLVLALLESFYLPPLPIPGAKVGISSLVSILLIAFYGLKEAISNVILRTAIVALLTGTFATPAFAFSLTAGLFSTLTMYAAYRLGKKWISLVGVSVFGGASHNLAQLALAIPLLGTWKVAYHLPFLIIVGTFTGLFNGWIAQTLANREDVLLSMGLDIHECGEGET